MRKNEYQEELNKVTNNYNKMIDRYESALEENKKLKSKLKKQAESKKHIKRKEHTDYVFNNEMDKIIQEFPKVIEETRMNKFLLEGDTGTGKSFSVNLLASMWMDNYGDAPESKYKILSLTNVPRIKTMIDNIGSNPNSGGDKSAIIKLKNELNNLTKKYKTQTFILFFDEADTIFRNRIIGSSENSFRNDSVNEMLKMLDDLDDRFVIFAATNFIENIDFAIRRRFDHVIKFDHSQYDIQYKQDIYADKIARLKIDTLEIDWEKDMHSIDKQINRLYFFGKDK